MDSVSQNHLPPNFDFSSDFAYFILEEILDNLKMAHIQIKNEKSRFLGEVPPNFVPGGGNSSPISPGGDAHAFLLQMAHAGGIRSVLRGET